MLSALSQKSNATYIVISDSTREKFEPEELKQRWNNYKCVSSGGHSRFLKKWFHN